MFKSFLFASIVLSSLITFAANHIVLEGKVIDGQVAFSYVLK